MMTASRFPNRAPHAMQAHRLWIKLWISLGHPAENCREPGGNAAVTHLRPRTAHSLHTYATRAAHSACVRPRPSSPAQTWVIPRIHRPYDDYQTSYVRQINPSIGLCQQSQPPKEEGDR
jgi:hypothetical protein